MEMTIVHCLISSSLIDMPFKQFCAFHISLTVCALVRPNIEMHFNHENRIDWIWHWNGIGKFNEKISISRKSSSHSLRQTGSAQVCVSFWVLLFMCQIGLIVWAYAIITCHIHQILCTWECKRSMWIDNKWQPLQPRIILQTQTYSLRMYQRIEFHVQILWFGLATTALTKWKFSIMSLPSSSPSFWVRERVCRSSRWRAFHKCKLKFKSVDWMWSRHFIFDDRQEPFSSSFVNDGNHALAQNSSCRNTHKQRLTHAQNGKVMNSTDFETLSSRSVLSLLLLFVCSVCSWKWERFN